MNYIIAFLPLILFLAIWFAIGYYYSCKVKEHKNSIKEDPSRPRNCLTLIRGVEQTNYLRAYKVIVDGESLGTILSGETKHFELEPGEHEAQVKIDWCKSKPYKITLGAGDNIELICGATFNDWKCLFMFAVKPSSYVYIKAA